MVISRAAPELGASRAMAAEDARRVYSPKSPPPTPPVGGLSADSRLTVLLLGARPSIQGLLSRFPESADITVDGHVYQMRMIRPKPVDEVCLRANSIIMDSMDVVVVVESVRRLVCTHGEDKRCSRCSPRMPGAGSVSRSSLGGLTAQGFIGDEASHLAEESGAAFMLVASEAHLRGLPHPAEMGETTREEFEATAEALGGKYLELSTETGEGVDPFLDAAARLALQTRGAREVHSRVRQLRGKRLESQSRRSVVGFKDGSPKIASHAGPLLEDERSTSNEGWIQSLPSLLCTRDLGPKRKAGPESAAAALSSEETKPPASAVEMFPEWVPEGVPPAWMPASIMSEMAPMSPIKDTLSSAQDTLQDAGRLILNGVRNVV